MDDIIPYAVARTLHVACATLSIGGFVLRGALRLAESPWLRLRFVRIAPHVVDTVLLLSALWLAVRLGQYPFMHGWLTAKVLALLAYIGLGVFALGERGSRGWRAVALAGATAAAGYIVSVALTRDVGGFLVFFAR